MTQDLFEQYYTEKLWEAIPSIYRHEDGLAEEPGVLRAIVQVVAKQAAILRRSQDSLWDDQFIELCNEWAVPYIGELVATRLLSAQNKRGRRIDVAKTIYYRRRKGTPRILEELINDISGWEGKLVEQFQKLARSRHGLDGFPETTSGKYSGTLPGGFADIRNQHASELSDGPFEEFFHTPDVRRHNGSHGRYAIPKLAFYLYRLKAYEAIAITPFSLGDGLSYSFDPSGRDIALFSKSRRAANWDDWRSAEEAELPAPIRCRLLAHAVFVITEAVIQLLRQLPIPLTPVAAVELRKLTGLSFKNESSLVNIISTFSTNAEVLNPLILQPLLSSSLVSNCGKSILLPDAETVLSKPLDTNSIVVGFESPTAEVFTTEQIVAANLEAWTSNVNNKLAIDAERGRFMLEAIPLIDQKIYIAYHYGFSGAIGAGSYDRPWIINANSVQSGGGSISSVALQNNGVTQISDSKTYGPIASKAAIVNMIFQSSSKQRPYICLESDWILNSGANLNSSITLDGLWIGAKGNLSASIILRGDFECVVIKNCTLDPGGSENSKGEIIHPITLIIEGSVENLCIESSILGPIKVQNNGIIETFEITDSIVQSVDTGIKTIEIKMGKTIINRSTVFGNVNGHRLEASETLFTGIVHIVDTQNGCFRFSAAPKSSRLPHPYESFLFINDSNHWFTSRRFGDSGYAQLSDTAPIQIKRGAETGSEMGAFSSLMNPIKLAGLQNKIDEYMPFGLIPIFINKT